MKKLTIDKTNFTNINSTLEKISKDELLKNLEQYYFDQKFKANQFYKSIKNKLYSVIDESILKEYYNDINNIVEYRNNVSHIEISGTNISKENIITWFKMTKDILSKLEN
jgi:lipopolysaccharide biosynthesis protein